MHYACANCSVIVDTARMPSVVVDAIKLATSWLAEASPTRPQRTARREEPALCTLASGRAAAWAMAARLVKPYRGVMRTLVASSAAGPSDLSLSQPYV